MKQIPSFFLLLPLLSFSAFSSANNIRIETLFDPPSITLSNTSTYKIIVHGSQQGPVGTLPVIDGLIFSNTPRTLRSASFINGVPSIRFELSFAVTPQREGTFSVPSWPLDVDGKSYQAPATKLLVLPPNQVDKIRQAEKNKQEKDLKQAAFLEFSCPRPFLFKGETTEATIDLFLWNKLPVTAIEQAPLNNANEFSISALGKPTEQTNIRRFNKNYTVVSWKFGITGSLPGKHALSFTSSIRVRLRNNRNSPSSNPFFSDPFFGFGRSERLQIKSDPLQFEVKPLPSTNRPDGFSGAIGNFSIESILDTKHVSVGDPIQLTCKISGVGNLAVMPAPKLSLGEHFKVGPPTFSFEGNELTKYQGSQKFEYFINPLKAGLIEVPAIPFSFFDPYKEKYFSTTTTKHSIRVDPGEKWVAPSNFGTPQDGVNERVSSQDFFQTEQEPGQWVRTLSIPKPLNSPTFWFSQIFCILAASSILFLRIRRRDQNLELLRQKDKLLDGKIRQALKHKDSSGFHRALRRKIRLRVEIACEQPNTSALSSTEIIKLLKEKNFSEGVISEILNLLNICDDLEYAQQPNTPSTLELTSKKASKILKKIK